MAVAGDEPDFQSLLGSERTNSSVSAGANDGGYCNFVGSPGLIIWGFVLSN